MFERTLCAFLRNSKGPFGKVSNVHIYTRVLLSQPKVLSCQVHESTDKWFCLLNISRGKETQKRKSPIMQKNWCQSLCVMCAARLSISAMIFLFFQECASEKSYCLAMQNEGLMEDLVKYLNTPSEQLKMLCANAIFRLAEEKESRHMVKYMKKLMISFTFFSKTF